MKEIFEKRLNAKIVLGKSPKNHDNENVSQRIPIPLLSAYQKSAEMGNKKTTKQLNAKIILGKCPNVHGNKNVSRLFAMRIEERNRDWIRTWAFKIDAEKARREGYDDEVTWGTMAPSADYPGCPYCGNMNIAQCSCGKIFCWTGAKSTVTCPWCGQSGECQSVDKLNVQRTGF